MTDLIQLQSARVSPSLSPTSHHSPSPKQLSALRSSRLQADLVALQSVSGALSIVLKRLDARKVRKPLCRKKGGKRTKLKGHGAVEKELMGGLASSESETLGAIREEMDEEMEVDRAAEGKMEEDEYNEEKNQDESRWMERGGEPQACFQLPPLALSERECGGSSFEIPAGEFGREISEFASLEELEGSSCQGVEERG